MQDQALGKPQIESRESKASANPASSTLEVKTLFERTRRDFGFPESYSISLQEPGAALIVANESGSPSLVTYISNREGRIISSMRINLKESGQAKYIPETIDLYPGESSFNLNRSLSDGIETGLKGYVTLLPTNQGSVKNLLLLLNNGATLPGETQTNLLRSDRNSSWPVLFPQNLDGLKLLSPEFLVGLPRGAWAMVTSGTESQEASIMEISSAGKINTSKIRMPYLTGNESSQLRIPLASGDELRVEIERHGEFASDRLTRFLEGKGNYNREFNLHAGDILPKNNHSASILDPTGRKTTSLHIVGLVMDRCKEITKAVSKRPKD